MGPPAWLTFRDAWWHALYGDGGFYRSASPADHFRTSVHASPLFAAAIVELVRRHDLDSVTDLGAGGGELLSQIHLLAPDLRLRGVEVRTRPATLAADIGWQRHLGVTRGLLIANELLDNVPVDVVELSSGGTPCVVEVQPQSGLQRLGAPVDEAAQEWLASWWPLASPGQRAEVGLPRDEMWKQACARVEDGVCLAVDYGHTQASRPVGDTVASYRAGRQRPVCLDGHHDVTSHVCFDSVARAVDGSLRTQAEALAELGVSGARPPVEQAGTDPAGYVRALASASAAAELTQGGGLGDFCWLVASAR